MNTSRNEFLSMVPKESFILKYNLYEKLSDFIEIFGKENNLTKEFGERIDNLPQQASSYYTNPLIYILEYEDVRKTSNPQDYLDIMNKEYLVINNFNNDKEAMTRHFNSFDNSNRTKKEVINYNLEQLKQTLKKAENNFYKYANFLFFYMLDNNADEYIIDEYRKYLNSSYFICRMNEINYYVSRSNLKL